MKKIDWFNTAIGLMALVTFTAQLFICRDDAFIQIVLATGAIASIFYLIIFAYEK